MKYELVKNREVVASLADVNIELGLLGAQSVVQDNMCDYFQMIGADGPTMVPKCNCFFVVSKSKIIFHKRLSWQDKISVKSNVCGKSRIKINLQTIISTETGEVAAECVQEMVAIDASNRSIKALNATLVPEDLEVSGATDIEFAKLNYELSEMECVKDVIVESTNVDFYKHTNNVEYIRLMLSTINVDYLKSHYVDSFEINYVTESRSGESLKIYRKDMDTKLYFQIMNGENVVTKALLNVSGRDSQNDLF